MNTEFRPDFFAVTTNKNKQTNNDEQNASEERAGRSLNLVRQGADGEEEEEEKARVASAVALASARSELAGLLHEQGKLLEAEELYRCVIHVMGYFFCVHYLRL